MTEFTKLSDIERKEVKWLWEPYLPRGMMTILEGDPDLGKSYLAMHISTEVSKRQGELPDTNLRRPKRVLYFSQEDDPAYTIRPRIEDMGGDVDRVKVHTGDSIFDEEGLKVFEDEIDEWKPDLIVVDPLVGYIGSKTDFFRSNEVRPVLRAISNLAERTNAALLVIRHLVKAKQEKSLYQGGGSIDFVAFVRSALRVERHPDDDNARLLFHIKHNLSRPAPTLSYRLVEQEAPKRPRLEWLGTTDMTLEDIGKVDREDPSELDRAVSFIREKLADTEMAASEIKTQADAYGIADRTLDRAKEQLGVKSKKKGRVWCWFLPDTPLKNAK